MIAERSVSVLSNMLEDIKRIWFTLLSIVQSIFIVFYSYSIYSNLNKLTYLIIYSILFLLSIISFVMFLINNKHNIKVSKTYHRTKNFLKYLVNSTMIIVKIVEMVQYGISDFNNILLIISTISLIVQIIIEFIKIFAEKYIKDIKNAFEKDFEMLDVRKWKSNILKIIDAPLEKLALMKEGKEKELSKDEQRLENHQKRYKERKTLRDEQKEIERKKKKIEIKEQENLNVQNELLNLKSHISTIFSKTAQDNSIDNKKAE